MKNILIYVALACILIIGGGIIYQKNKISAVQEKIYVAVEGDGKISVIDPATRKLIKDIHLYEDHDGERLHFMPHNVQVAPNGKSVWVTANLGSHGHSFNIVNRAHAHGSDEPGDSVFVINPLTDAIVTSVTLDEGIGLAHVVLTPDSKFAYVSAQTDGVIYKVDTETFSVVNGVQVSPQSEPHGMRVSPDGKLVYVAALKGKSLGIIDTATDVWTEIPLRGAPVQTGVTNDGVFVVVSLYDTKELAIYDTRTKEISYVTLPSDARGPIQMYGTPDSRFMYLADQGYYFNQPVSDKVYKIDLLEKKVVGEIKAGSAPHGVVVSPDGAFVYITNLKSDDVSIIETASDKEIARMGVGKEPNGISYWSRVAE